MKNYKKLKIWQQGIQIVKKTYELTKKLPESEKYNLISQMNRASVSIPSNIAEGSSRKSDKDFNRFLQIALGSSFELDTQCEVVKELYVGFDKELEELQNKVDEECRMIQGFINKITENN
ncbi:four helix bundle protein [Carboxylicivirga marina]|uniref:four helix bundle protein n=1 Tax=Carboxylicivirga marina TaxID=2800988 RepID=UPI002598DB38|nr:four helix bundle protein [uncultured Carboxylicivirga sp.]